MGQSGTVHRDRRLQFVTRQREYATDVGKCGQLSLTVPTHGLMQLCVMNCVQTVSIREPDGEADTHYNGA
jgi:hypothetical protein